MNNFGKKRALAFALISFLLFFTACGGGDDPAPQLEADDNGNDLQQILAQMNKDAAQFAVGSQGGSDEKGTLSSVQTLLALLPQRYNEYRISADKLCVPGEGGIGLTRQQCEDKFWHFVVYQKGSEIMSSLSGASPELQLAAAHKALTIFQGLNINPPQEFLNDVRTSIDTLKGQVGGTSLSTQAASIVGNASFSSASANLLGIGATNAAPRDILVTLPVK